MCCTEKTSPLLHSSNFKWPWYDCSSGRQNDYSGNPGYVPFSVVDCQHISLIFDTGIDAPLTIHAVNVWQSTDANNLHFDVPFASPFPYTPGAPTR